MVANGASGHDGEVSVNAHSNSEKILKVGYENRIGGFAVYSSPFGGVNNAIGGFCSNHAFLRQF